MHSNSTRFAFVSILACILFASSARVASQAPAAGTRLEVAPGSKAGYRVNEQLARLKFPNDAVGTTETISGILDLRPDGTFSSDSKLTVDLRTLKSDEARRDAYLRQNTLETDKFPLAEFVPKRQTGLTVPIPSSGTAKFRLTGDMTMHGVTAETTFDVNATLGSDLVTAQATTNFPFSKFNLTIPRMLALISVADDIRLELDVRLRRR